MAILPRDIGQVISNLHKNSLFEENDGWKRVVIEKPWVIAWKVPGTECADQ